MRQLLCTFVALACIFMSNLSVADNLNDSAERYVKLVLALGQHDAGYVDAYYGPSEWATQAEQKTKALPIIVTEAEQLLKALPSSIDSKDAMLALRLEYLKTQLETLAAYASFKLHTPKRDFDREAKAFYDTVPPLENFSEFDATLLQLEALLPGDKPINERVEDFLQAFEIPSNKVAAVFDAAIAECRSRTKRYIDLPESESFELEYVTNKPWSGYNWYKGGSHSLIQVNIDLPIRIDRAIDLGCHEGYPGHHTYNALLEQALVNKRGWVEFSVYPLFSPQSLIAEGTANYGIALTFPGDEKTAFEAEVLYPLAGLAPITATKYEEFQTITAKLSFARNQIARLYINGDIDREKAIVLSQKYSVSSRKRAEQSVSFIDTYGAYVINYNWGQLLVKEYVEAKGEGNKRHWQEFKTLISSPRMPSSLVVDKKH